MSKTAYLKRHELSAGQYIILDFCQGWLETGYVSSGLVVIVRSMEQQLLGLVHVVLPYSSSSSGKAKSMPGYFADTGIELLLAEFGCSLPEEAPKDLEIYLIGAAGTLVSDDIFDLGLKNLHKVKNILEESGFSISGQDVEGHFTRKVLVNLETGQIWIYSPGRKTLCL